MEIFTSLHRMRLLRSHMEERPAHIFLQHDTYPLCGELAEIWTTMRTGDESFHAGVVCELRGAKAPSLGFDARAPFSGDVAR